MALQNIPSDEGGDKDLDDDEDDDHSNGASLIEELHKDNVPQQNDGHARKVLKRRIAHTHEYTNIVLAP
jgi:hypothetical protein